MTEADSTPAAATDDDQVLLERLAKREERRQKRMMEAMERQKDNDVSETNGTENDGSLQQTDKEEENQPAAKEEADVNSCRTADEDQEEGKKVKKNEFPIMSVLFEAIFHISSPSTGISCGIKNKHNSPGTFIISDFLLFYQQIHKFYFILTG